MKIILRMVLIAIASAILVALLFRAIPWLSIIAAVTFYIPIAALGLKWQIMEEKEQEAPEFQLMREKSIEQGDEKT